MTGQEYRAAILSSGMTITAYAQHIGLTRHALGSRFKLAKVTNEMVLAVERVADRWFPIESAPRDGISFLAHWPHLDGLYSRNEFAVHETHWTNWGGGMWESNTVGKGLHSPTCWKPLPKWEKQS
jgi:hypothetical protein